ncbi:dTMP kinase [Prosthecomicrobium pneumaticum]|uniref:Thymidylate kinase n=1 Tax=Prosthecomicrobium pneumaticum TaxID=81895 RepID=A0A7W9FJ11_9HYPH|nr:dTMP kinase [Prosthecomicrobium pneumaticum]MBB5751257.1 dTMP kinase [Prosthecomicrobium pneumaticum]
MAGRFVTFEGGEGAGKTTQIRRLAARLEVEGIAVVTTREPGGTPRAETIRDFILSGQARALGVEAEAALFAAARADHVATVIRPALAAGRWVLCDRFADSTRAYQGADGADPDFLGALEAVAVGATRPDLTVVLDLPVEDGLARIAGRGGGPDRFEAETIERHRRRRAIFLEIAAREPQRCVVLDGRGSPEAVADAVWRTVRERLIEGAR